jgi:translation elongation factor EF-Ts
LFINLSSTIAQTLLLSSTSVADLERVLQMPVQPRSKSDHVSDGITATVQKEIIDGISKTGEKIGIRRIAEFVTPENYKQRLCFFQSFLHGKVQVADQQLQQQNLKFDFGKIGAVVEFNQVASDLSPDARDFCAKLAQQVVGLKPSSVAELLDSEFLFEPSKSVQAAFDQIKSETGQDDLQLVSFQRFECGESL